MELPEYVARGVDMMDCVLPSRNAFGCRQISFEIVRGGPRKASMRDQVLVLANIIQPALDQTAATTSSGLAAAGSCTGFVPNVV